MYKFVDWMKCKDCGETNCLFRFDMDYNHLKRTSNKLFRNSGWCKKCYLLYCRDAVSLSRENPTRRERERQYALNHYKNNILKYRLNRKKYYIKNRMKILEKQRVNRRLGV